MDEGEIGLAYARNAYYLIDPYTRTEIERMGFFDDLGHIDTATGGSPKLTPGTYVVEVEKCHINQGHHGTYFVAELLVRDAQGADATPVGSSVSWTANIGGTWAKLGKGEVKAFVAACLGVDPKAGEATVNQHVTPEVMDAIVGGDGTWLAGRTAATDAFTKHRPDKPPLTKHNWYPATTTAAPAPAVAPPLPAPAAPTVPPLPVAPPPAPTAPPLPPAFPPAGWTAHPSAPGHFYKGQEVLSEAQLRARG